MRNPVPQFAERILMALGADAEFRDDVLGDLAEEFEQRALYDVRSARRWYYGETLRVAPYLLRNCWRMRRRGDLKRFAGVLVRTSLIMIVLQIVLRIGFVVVAAPGLARWPSLTLFFVLLAVRLFGAMLSGAVAGYVATRLDRKAPLTSALLFAVTWSVVMVLTAPGLLVLQVLQAQTMVAGVVLGSLLGVQRLSRRLQR